MLKQLELSLEVLIPCYDTAAWRRQKAAQYPEDDRNAQAAEVLNALGQELATLDESALHHHLHRLYFDCPGFDFHNRTSEILREIGFHYQPGPALQFLTALVKQFKTEAAAAADELLEQVNQQLFEDDTGTYLQKWEGPRQPGYGPYLEILSSVNGVVTPQVNLGDFARKIGVLNF